METVVRGLADTYGAVGGKSIAYDADGRVSQVQGGGESTVYSWNRFGELSGVTGVASRQFAYDALGRLVKENSSTFVTWFGDRRIARWRADVTQADVQFCGDGVDEPLVQSSILHWTPSGGPVTERHGEASTGGGDEDPPPDGPLPPWPSPPALVFIHTNPTGSPYLLFDSEGQIESEYRFTAFGEVLPSTLAGNRKSAWLGYQGHQQLLDVGLVSMRARWYRPDLGRFLSPDPIDLADGSNRYAFVGSSPLDHRDPTGLRKWYDFLHVKTSRYFRESGNELLAVALDSNVSYGDRAGLGRCGARATPRGGGVRRGLCHQHTHRIQRALRGRASRRERRVGLPRLGTFAAGTG
jgi:RHS repeat-associated protein